MCGSARVRRSASPGIARGRRERRPVAGRPDRSPLFSDQCACVREEDEQVHGIARRSSPMIQHFMATDRAFARARM
ncbi:DUF2274 domain-containing protein [Pelagibacterium halotolerans]|nr:DUF2274 domain-containing protein [Pelagibacterium halotolerans]